MTDQPCAATLRAVARVLRRHQSLGSLLTNSAADALIEEAKRVESTPSPGAGGERALSAGEQATVKAALRQSVEVISDRPPAEAAGRGGDEKQVSHELWCRALQPNGAGDKCNCGFEGPRYWPARRGGATGMDGLAKHLIESASPPTSPAGEEPDGVWFPIWHFERRPVGETDEKVMLRLGRNTNLAGETVYITRPSPPSGASGLVKEWHRNKTFSYGEALEWGDRRAARIQELEGEVKRLSELPSWQTVRVENQRAIDAEAERDACKERVEKLARWIVREADQREGRAKPFPVIYDHACARCGGSLTADHFVCAVHMARDFVASLPAPSKQEKNDG